MPVRFVRLVKSTLGFRKHSRFCTVDNATFTEQNDQSLSRTQDFTNASCLLIMRNEFELEGLRGLLANRGMKSISINSNTETAIETMSSLKSDVIIVDTEDLMDAPMKLFAAIRNKSARSEIILLFDESSLKNKYSTTAASGVGLGFVGIKLLLRSTLRDGDRMAEIVEQVRLGHTSVESDVVDFLIQNQAKYAESLENKLTRRELQVLERVCVGASNNEIARQLQMSSPYVGNVLTRVFAKLGLREKSDINRRVAASREYLLEYGFRGIRRP